MTPADRAEKEALGTAVAESLGEEAFARAVEAGRSLSLEDATALATGALG